MTEYELNAPSVYDQSDDLILDEQQERALRWRRVAAALVGAIGVVICGCIMFIAVVLVDQSVESGGEGTPIAKRATKPPVNENDVEQELREIASMEIGGLLLEEIGFKAQLDDLEQLERRLPITDFRNRLRVILVRREIEEQRRNLDLTYQVPQLGDIDAPQINLNNLNDTPGFEVRPCFDP